MISVCMTAYNGEKYIGKQLDSILCQLTDSDEIIISDDGSTDNTVEIILSYTKKDKRIKLHFNEKRKGVVGNFENALNYAHGDYIFLSDQDDVWLSDKVKVIMGYLEKYDCVISDALIIDANENILYDSFYKINNTKKGFLHNFIKNGYLGCCMAFNRRILKYILPFPLNIPMHDIWIGLIAELAGRTIFCKEKLIYYRRHGLNQSMASEKSKNPITVRLGYRFNLLYNLFKRQAVFKK